MPAMMDEVNEREERDEVSYVERGGRWVYAEVY